MRRDDTSSSSVHPHLPDEDCFLLRHTFEGARSTSASSIRTSILTKKQRQHKKVSFAPVVQEAADAYAWEARHHSMYYSTAELFTFREAFKGAVWERHHQMNGTTNQNDEEDSRGLEQYDRHRTCLRHQSRQAVWEILQAAGRQQQSKNKTTTSRMEEDGKVWEKAARWVQQCTSYCQEAAFLQGCYDYFAVYEPPHLLANLPPPRFYPLQQLPPCATLGCGSMVGMTPSNNTAGRQAKRQSMSGAGRSASKKRRSLSPPMDSCFVEQKQRTNDTTNS